LRFLRLAMEMELSKEIGEARWNPVGAPEGREYAV
jgi:hypothetical protein